MKLNLADGRTTYINAPDNSDENFYISSMKVDGKDWTRNWLEHDQIVSGIEIEYEMASEPVFSRGTSENDRPYSFSKER